MVPEKTGGISVAGRWISVDEIAFGSTRNVPAGSMSGEAAAIAAACSALDSVRNTDVLAFVQDRLRRNGATLGTPR